MILQGLHDQAPSGPVTLQWLMGRLHQQSFGMIMLILGIVAAAPGISLLTGLLLLVVAFQMVLGHPAPNFPSWMATRALPTRHVDTSCGVPSPFSRVSKARFIRASAPRPKRPSGSLALCRPSPTLTASGQQPDGRSEIVHPIEDRKLSIREMMRLSSWPDDFVFTETVAQAAIRIGMSVPPLMTKAVGDAVYEEVLQPYHAAIAER